MIAFAVEGERPGDLSVVSPAVSWLAYTADRLRTFEARSEDVPLVSCLEAFQLNAVCGWPLFSPCRDRNVHRLVPEPTTLPLFGTTAAGLGLARWKRRSQQ